MSSTILVVDDDPSVRLLAREALNQAGFKVLDASDGQRAIELFLAHTPSLILLDVLMPGLDGFAVCRAVRARPEGARVPILMLTGLEDIESISSAYEAGATDFTTKPINWFLLGHRARYLIRAGERSERLRISESRNRALLAAIPDTLWRFSADGELHPEGPATIFSGSADVRQSTPFRQSTLPEHIRSHLPNALASNHPIQLEHRLQINEIEHHLEIRLVRSSEIEVIAIIRDISDRVESEARLRQAQKMEAIGQLTSGLAHDFNNLLTVIGGNLRLLQMELNECGDPAVDGEWLELLDDANSATNEAAELTKRLLAFARKQPLQPRPTDVNVLISDFGRLLKRTLGREIELCIDTSSALPKVVVDGGQLQNALLNLAINARDAMPKGGRLTVSTRLMDAIGDELPPGRYVCISVTDTGSGMSPEVRSKAFDPFFTTKGEGRGTGLGLSMVYGFTAQSGGGVTIESELGEGTTVSLLLPSAGEQPIEPVPAQEPDFQSCRVLVVEDEERVRRLAARYLRDLGYQVLEVECADRAVELLAEGERIGILFSDIFMPGEMDGLDLAHWVRRERPEIAVLLTSGFTELNKSQPTRDLQGLPLLSKPYSREQLMEAIEALRALVQ